MSSIKSTQLKLYCTSNRQILLTSLLRLSQFLYTSSSRQCQTFTLNPIHLSLHSLRRPLFSTCALYVQCPMLCPFSFSVDRVASLFFSRSSSANSHTPVVPFFLTLFSRLIQPSLLKPCALCRRHSIGTSASKSPPLRVAALFTSPLSSGG